jgi:antitoxin component YwqK of YwqJK toxin-antitoxin module
MYKKIGVSIILILLLGCHPDEVLYTDSSDETIKKGVIIQKVKKGILICEYKNGKKHGSFEMYNNNSKLVNKGTYRKGKKHGIWYFYLPSYRYNIDSTMALYNETTYYKGNLVGYQRYNIW